MSERKTNGSVPAFGNFLAYLRLQGFRIGLDHYVRVQELLERIGGNRDLDQLRTLLCPLFATSEKQQKRFYDAFDDYAELVQAPSPPPPPPPPDPEKAKKPEREKKRARLRFYLAGAGSLLTVLLIGLALGVIPTPSFMTWTPQPTPEVTPKPDETPIPTPTEVPKGKGSGGFVEPLPVTPQPTSAPTAEIPPATEEKPVIAPPAPLRFYLLVISALLALYILWELYRFLRRKLFLRRQAARKPPSIWPIRVEAPAVKIYDSEDFYRAARLMRRRQVAEYHRLDVNATVAATISALGYPTFRYKPDSKAPEYLVLIDRASFRDHQAQLFNELITAFEQEGLFVVRYFYEGDPRVCCDDKGENCVHLSELQNQYVGHRLLIFGNGDKLLDPITGRLAAWTSMFLDWQDRAVLTPEARWELREFSLATQFIVLPASLDGLMALVDHFDTMVTTDPRIWSPSGVHEPPADLDERVNVEELKSYLGDPAFQWLCACSVYPELQWNLTLYLGSLGCLDPGTVREQNLLRLIRLPWFRAGSVPDSMRWPLINQLGEKREPEVRSAIINLLEKSPPPVGTIAADKYDLELAVQHWRREQDADSLKKLHRVMSRLTPGQILKDQTLVHYLEREPNPVLDLLLPRRLRKYFFRRGIPSFGLKTGFRFVIILLLISLASILIRNQTIPVPAFLQNPVASPTVTPPETPTDVEREAARRAEEEAKRRNDLEQAVRQRYEEERRRLGQNRPTPSPTVSSRVSPRPSPPVISDPSLRVRPETFGETTRLQPGETKPGPDNSVISVAFQRNGPLYTRTFQNSDCPIESIRVQKSVDEMTNTEIWVRRRSGEVSKVKNWATPLTDSCKKIFGKVPAPIFAPSPTPLPTSTPTRIFARRETPAVVMPSFIGLTERQMRTKLAASKLKLGQLTYQPQGTPGLVIDQYPVQGATIPEGFPADFVVGKARDDSTLVPVPNVVGMFTSRAIRALEAVGLTYEIVGERGIGQSSSDSRSLFTKARWEYEVVPGEKKVFRQDPPAGKIVKPGTTVRLWARY